MDILKNFMLIAGCLILVASLRPVWQLMVPLPGAHIRFQWKVLLGLICLFICGYLIYTVLFWQSYSSLADLIVPVIFLSGAIFVFLVCTLSLQTARDLERIYVLERENMTDPLMGIYNRRYFDRRLYEEFCRSVRYRQQLSLIMLDIDHFKVVNDRWGHQVGDLVLKRLAELLRGTVRDLDVVCRYGGEELAIILPHTSAESTLVLAERLRKKIENTVILTEDASPDNQSIQVTASLGVSELMAQMETVDMLVSQADKALYSAKMKGRNCVVVCRDLNDNERC